MLQPSEGMVLTQAADVALAERIFSTKIFLAVNDSEANYREITEAEAADLKEAQQAEAQRRLEAEERERKRRQLEAELARLNEDQTSAADGAQQ